MKEVSRRHRGYARSDRHALAPGRAALHSHGRASFTGGRTEGSLSQTKQRFGLCACRLRCHCRLGEDRHLGLRVGRASRVHGFGQPEAASRFAASLGS